MKAMSANAAKDGVRHINGYVLRAFIDSCRDHSAVDLGRIIRKNYSGISNIIDRDSQLTQEIIENQDVIPIQHLVNAVLRSLKVPGNRIPAEAGLRLARDFASLYAANQTKEGILTDEIVQRLGREAVVDNVDRNMVVRRISEAAIEIDSSRMESAIQRKYSYVLKKFSVSAAKLGLGVINLGPSSLDNIAKLAAKVILPISGKAPSALDEVARLLYFVKEDEISDFALITPFFPERGVVDVEYLFPCSKHLATRFILSFGKGTLEGVPRLILPKELLEKNSVTVRQVSDGEPFTDLFGEEILLETKPPLSESLSHVPHSVEKGKLRIFDFPCADVDENGIARFFTNVTLTRRPRFRSDLITTEQFDFRLGESVMVEEPLPFYRLRLSYTLPVKRGNKFFIQGLAVACSSLLSGATGFALSNGDGYVALGSAIMGGVAAGAGISSNAFSNPSNLNQALNLQTIAARAESQHFHEEMQDSLSALEKTIASLARQRNLLSEQEFQLNEARAKLDQTRKELEHAELIGGRSILARGLVHDMNNLFFPITLYLSSREKMAQNFEEINIALDRYLKLFESLGRTLRGEDEPKQTLLLSDVLRDSSVFSRIKKYGGELSIEIPLLDGKEGLPVPVKCSQISLQQIVQNLLGNAMEANAKKINARIEIENIGRERCLGINRQPYGLFAVSEGPYAILTVSDDGDGIASGNIETIFNLHISSKSKEPEKAGRGIGLAAVKARARLENICIKVSSKAKKEHPDSHGTEFNVYVPLYLGDMYGIYAKKLLGI